MSDGWEVIHAYTRKQAIEDGVFIDVTEIASVKGFRCSVVITNGIYAELFRDNNFDKNEFYNLIDLLITEMRKKDFQLGEIYEVTFKGVRVWMDACWDDEGKAAMTIMLPEEY